MSAAFSTRRQQPSRAFEKAQAAAFLAQADVLQKRGFTLSEIAEGLGCDRKKVVDALYWARVWR